jgi:acyl carrier protein
MTVKELIQELSKARDWDEEVGLLFEDGWSSIKGVDISSGYSQKIRIEAEDTLFDRQFFEACPECKVLFEHLDGCSKG